MRSLAEKSAKRADYKIYADDGTGFGSVWEPVRKNGLARARAINQGSALNPARWRVGVGGGGGGQGRYIYWVSVGSRNIKSWVATSPTPYQLSWSVSTRN